MVIEFILKERERRTFDRIRFRYQIFFVRERKREGDRERKRKRGAGRREGTEFDQNLILIEINSLCGGDRN